MPTRTLTNGGSKMNRPVAFTVLLVGLSGCVDPVTTTGEVAPNLDAELRQDIAAWGLMAIGDMPTQPLAQVELGRMLFFDKIMSGNQDVACATCHQPAEGLGDGRSLPVGTRATLVGGDRMPGAGRDFIPRNAPTLLNSGVGGTYMLWDGRLANFGPGSVFAEGLSLPIISDDGLATQAFLPVLNRGEMRGEAGDTGVHGATNELANVPDTQPEAVWRGVMDRLLAVPQYVTLFQDAYPEVSGIGFRYEHAARALSAFQRETFTFTDSPFDRYLARDNNALTVEQKRGAQLFLRDAGCVSCHNGPLLGGQGFANVGMPQIGPGVGDEAPLDLGRGALENNEFYRFAFRIPPLRNVELTAPYMHAGAYPDLEAVLDHYNDVPTAMREYDVGQLDPALRGRHHTDSQMIQEVLETLDGRFRGPLDLDEGQIADLTRFLEALTDPAARDLSSVVPTSVPSGLPVGE
ncbi:MAG: cytochrome-c peroxidase [Longimicrobiales bacterium]